MSQNLLTEAVFARFRGIQSRRQEENVADGRPRQIGGMMRRFMVLLALTATLALSLALVGQAGAKRGGLSAGQLNSHGWTCFNVPGLGVHCSPPGQPWPPTKPHQQLLYFFNTTDPTSRAPDFTGTESLLRDDHFHGQPCPTEGGHYTNLGFLGLPNYWGCHRQTP